jgi:acylphosphatase
MIVARKFIVSGTVQGVGFRFFTQRSAATHQVSGYVKNLKNGDVESYVEGKIADVEKFKQDLLTGPIYAKVEHIEETVLEPTSLYSTFRVEK